MEKIVDAEALIIDLRENNGGSPETVAFVASYLFDRRILINQIYRRSTDETTYYFAEPDTLDLRFGEDKPVYVLTSDQTFSAGEELAYDLQSAHRAKTIGQATAGGAHPVRPFVVDDHLLIIIPAFKAINPYTHKNWEGTGVIPNHSI